jgi:hypothetical protein
MAVVLKTVTSLLFAKADLPALPPNPSAAIN